MTNKPWFFWVTVWVRDLQEKGPGESSLGNSKAKWGLSLRGKGQEEGVIRPCVVKHRGGSDGNPVVSVGEERTAASSGGQKTDKM